MPCKYKDLSKKGDDLFAKGFEAGHYKVELASKNEGFEFTTKGHLKAGAVDGSSHEIKLKCPMVKGGQFKSTFTPGKDALACEYEYSNAAKVTACFGIPLNNMPVPNVSALKVNWSNEKAHVNVGSNLGNKLDFDAVVALTHANVGVNLTVDPSSMAIAKKELAFNWQAGSINATCKTSGLKDFNCVMHNQVNSKLQLATMVSHGCCGLKLALAGQQKGCCGSHHNFKLTHDGRFSVSHVTPFRMFPATSKLTISGDFDATNLASGSHKFGAGLKFDL